MGLEALEKIKGCKCHGDVQLCAVKGVSDKVDQLGVELVEGGAGRGMRIGGEQNEQSFAKCLHL